jgi:hypothetical protein
VGPATKEQIRQARTQFESIFKILHFDKFPDPDAFVIGKRADQPILKGQLPKWVHDLRFETGLDASGDPAIWIWVVVDDEAGELDVISANFRAIQDQLVRWLKRIGEKRWPYIRLQTVSEQVPSA